MDRLFSRDEAELLLPTLVPDLTALQDYANQLDRARERLGTLPFEDRSNGHADEANTLQQEIARLIDAMTALIDRVQALGVEIKDVRTGLIDFRSKRDGRIVYLCWRLGEPRLLFWHHLDAGLAGRQPLD